MNIALLEQAKARVPSVPVLVNMVSMRFRQLNEGMRPLVKPFPEEDRLDLDRLGGLRQPAAQGQRPGPAQKPQPHRPGNTHRAPSP